jgi:hypothetical protein
VFNGGRGNMIGIIGGYGEVGLEVTHLLKKYNKHS